MRCNFNLNQCNFSPSFPRPIFTCGRSFICALSNNSGNDVINPVLPEITFALFTSTTIQTISAGGNVVTNLISTNGDDVVVDGGGNFMLQQGVYRISYSATGVIPAGGTLSLALYQNGAVIPTSTGSVTGTPGNVATVNGSAIISIASSDEIVRLSNNLAESEIINFANISIVRIG